MIKRIICDIVLFLAIFLLPWWGTAILVFVFMILFKRFWEGIVAMFFIDSLYSLAGQRFYGRFGIFTVSAIIILFIVEYAKKQLRFNLS